MIIKLEHIDTGSFQITSQKYDKNEGLSFLCYNWSPRECSATFLLRHSRFVNENIAFLHLCVLFSRTSSRRFIWSHFFPCRIFIKLLLSFALKWQDSSNFKKFNWLLKLPKCNLLCEKVTSILYIYFFPFNLREASVARFQPNFFCQIWPVSHFLWAWLQ